LPASELLAELLVQQCAALQAVVERYNDVIDHCLGRDADQDLSLAVLSPA
jgi:hypothetical protein